MYFLVNRKYLLVYSPLSSWLNLFQDRTTAQECSSEHMQSTCVPHHHWMMAISCLPTQSEFRNQLPWSTNIGKAFKLTTPSTKRKPLLISSPFHQVPHSSNTDLLYKNSLVLWKKECLLLCSSSFFITKLCVWGGGYWRSGGIQMPLALCKTWCHHLWKCVHGGRFQVNWINFYWIQELLEKQDRKPDFEVMQ